MATRDVVIPMYNGADLASRVPEHRRVPNAANEADPLELSTQLVLPALGDISSAVQAKLELS